MNKKELQDLAKSLMLEISDEEASIIEQEFDLFLRQVNEINQVDTSDTKTLDFPFEEAIGVLREDIAEEVLSTEAVLKNAEDVSEDMVKIPKVVS